MENISIYNTIVGCIESKREDDWWDFKECHHKDKADLLHDILCMANSRANRDSYIIVGVRDKTYEIIGVESDPKRRNQQNIVEVLRSIHFAGKVRPRVEVRELNIEGKKVDVIVIKNSSDTPYYLEEDYKDKGYKMESGKDGKTVLKFRIYSRVLDNNTPINGNADFDYIEYLWKKRFGLLQTPLKQVETLLKCTKDWIEENEQYYHSNFPQFVARIEWSHEGVEFPRRIYPQFFHYNQIDSSTMYGEIKLFHYGTQLFSRQVTTLDSGRVVVPCPEPGFIYDADDNEPIVSYRYFLMDSILYTLFLFLKTQSPSDSMEANHAIRKYLELILLFEDSNEKDIFERYVKDNIRNFREIYTSISSSSVSFERPGCQEKDRNMINAAKALKKMQEERNRTHEF